MSGKRPRVKVVYLTASTNKTKEKILKYFDVKMLLSKVNNSVIRETTVDKAF